MSLDVCEPECFTDRAFFEGEIDEEIFNDIFPQVRWQYSYKWCYIPLKEVLAALTVEEANGLDTKADEAEPEIGAVIGSGADKNFASAAVFILSMYFT